jgi:hypothetical protein
MQTDGTPATAPEPPLLARLRGHFACDPARLPVVEQIFRPYERPNLHLAIEECLAEPGRRAELIGIVAQEDYHGVSLAKLARPLSASRFDEGPVGYRDEELPGGRHLACVKRGAWFLRDGELPLVLLVAEQVHAWPPGIVTEVMAAHRDRAEDFLRRLTRQTRFGKAYRGHVLSLEQDCHGALQVHYHSLPRIGRDEIILPEDVLRRVERHTLSFSRHADLLRAARRHIKRGILLHGLPGTGKTLTAMYLAAQMTGRTVLILTGRGMGIIETACTLARNLEPATVILEDVDLIGTEREHQTVGANALLFELLNQMDGLADDADVLFLLTTNRPDVLEPALAARPGRIDQAIEVPLPDADCRRRLFELYGRGLEVEPGRWRRLVKRTHVASGAFIRELLRKAAVLAAEDADGALVVSDGHLDEALDELLIAGGALTQSLLGAGVKARGEKRRRRRS